MNWGGTVISVLHMLPDSCGAVIAIGLRNMKMLSAPAAHRNTLGGNLGFPYNSFHCTPISSWKLLNRHQGEPKSYISSGGSFFRSRICESPAFQCRNTQFRDLSSRSRAAVGLSRGLLSVCVGENRFHEGSQRGCVASLKGDCDSHSKSPSSSCGENFLDAGREGGEDEEEENEEDNLDPNDEDDGLDGGAMQLAEEGPRVWDVRPKSKPQDGVYYSVALPENGGDILGLGELDSGLYLVGTPIGNLEDITLRALRILQSASCILAEDTRHSSKLLHHYGISTPTMSYHKFNEHARRRELIQRLQRGEVLALISDAGMPGISDPGSELVKACVEEDVKVFPIPGPSAALTALVASGLPTEEFSFVGFLSAQTSARRKRLLAASKESSTQIFYVPPHKLCRVLDDLILTFGAARRCAVAREMTKLHEEFWRSTLEEAKAEFEVRQPRGEVTLIVEGLGEGAGVEQASREHLMARLQILMDAGKGPSEASKLVVEETAARRNIVYSLALEISKASK